MGESSQRWRRISRWLREPLIHFFMIGAALFLVYHYVQPDPGSGYVFKAVLSGWNKTDSRHRNTFEFR